MEVKGFCVNALNTPYGIIVTLYIDAVADLASMTKIIGADIDAVTRGSIAYDKNGDIAIFDGTSWNVVGG